MRARGAGSPCAVDFADKMPPFRLVQHRLLRKSPRKWTISVAVPRLNQEFVDEGSKQTSLSRLFSE